MAKKKKVKGKKPKKPKIKKPRKIFRIINPMPFLIASGLIGVVVILAAGAYLNPNTIDTSKCRTNGDCDWKITNCCPETAGGFWECVNLREFKSPDCPHTVLCPQVLSPKPTTECICEEGRCVKEASK